MRESLLAQSDQYIPNSYGGGFTGIKIGVGVLTNQVGYFRIRNDTPGLRRFLAFVDNTFEGGIGGRVQAGETSTTQADTSMPRAWLDLQRAASSQPQTFIQAGNRGSALTFGAGGGQNIQIQPGHTVRYFIRLVLLQGQGYWIMALHPGTIQVQYWWFE